MVLHLFKPKMENLKIVETTKELEYRIEILRSTTMMLDHRNYSIEKAAIAAALRKGDYNGLNEKFRKVVNFCETYFSNIRNIEKEKSPFWFDFAR